MTFKKNPLSLLFIKGYEVLKHCTKMAGREETQGLLDENGHDAGNRRRMSPFCDPNHLLHRIVVLVFMCFLGFGELLGFFFLTSVVITQLCY